MVDVCLVLEGSYPYVTGGVSAWADGLLKGLPDVSFAVAHVRDEGHAPPAAYTLPDNAELIHVDLDPAESMPHPGAHLGLPEARVYHAACTGSAAELARLAAAEHGSGFAVTEHGIAWREARWGIDACKLARGFDVITGCKLARGFDVVTGCKLARGFDVVTGCKLARADAGRPLTREEQQRRADDVLAMALRAYAEADAVTSVCGPNVRLQQRMGAGAGHRLLGVIPNPVQAGPERADGTDGLLIGFVGRVVAVKDVATFLHACALVAERRTDARFAIVGPTHHEPEYAQACKDLAIELGLEDRVTFTGETDPAPWFARLDVLTLTSLSEAQPLVALEAMAAGVPVVATDVGGCREAIAGAGLLTPVRDPQATADALLQLAGDDLLRARLGAAGRHRARTAHGPARIYGAYRELYDRLAA